MSDIKTIQARTKERSYVPIHIVKHCKLLQQVRGAMFLHRPTSTMLRDEQTATTNNCCYHVAVSQHVRSLQFMVSSLCHPIFLGGPFL